MTEEELRKEATYTVEWESTPMIDRPLFVHGYITGAEPREKRIEELEKQIEKMKSCENCAWWYKLPNGQRDCAETCENLDNWSLRL